jgi:exodeoxyribonuclease V alpha subunit
MKKTKMEKKLDGGYFSPMDRHFAGFMARLAGETSSEELSLAAALASRSTGLGNTCLDLKDLAGKPLEDDTGGPLPVCPGLDSWRQNLKKSSVVGSPGQFKPLVLDQNSRLYFHRYYEYERIVAEKITELARCKPEKVDLGMLAEGLQRLFPGRDIGDRQRVAAACALANKLTVVSGGPGTGKTTTVAKILALFLEQTAGSHFRAALCAPTGKAAARLQEAIVNAKDSLDCSPEVKHAIPDAALTIHRLLGYKYGSSSRRYGPENHLPYDIVVVDEASMVDLSLMAGLLAALSPEARLILVGDRDQLASVEAGSVLGDICGEGEVPGFPQEFVENLRGAAALVPERHQRASRPVADCVVQLETNYRFGSQSGIGRLSKSVNGGDSRRALSLLTSGDYPDLSFSTLPRPGDLARKLKQRVIEGFRDYLAACDERRACELFGNFRILCPVRKGPYGVESINRLVERILAEEGLIRINEHWYDRRPVMINRNDYQLGLYNGDIGLVWMNEQGGTSVIFPSSEVSLKKILPWRLPEHDTVFAMTVHKSQGSEFDNVLVILPDNDSPVLTRELIYTAITRGRKKVEVLGNEDLLETAVSRKIVRSSGLRESLWGD